MVRFMASDIVYNIGTTVRFVASHIVYHMPPMVQLKLLLSLQSVVGWAEYVLQLESLL